VLLDWTMDLFFKPDVSYFTFPRRHRNYERSPKVILE
jgi:hypothetical protein